MKPITLAAHQFSVGCLGNADRLTLLYPRTQYERVFLIVPNEGAMIAVCLDRSDPQHTFHAFDCAGNMNWKGLLIPDVQIEVELSSVNEINGWHAPPGALLRRQSILGLSTRFEQSGYIEGSKVVSLVSDLAETAPDMAAAFTRWRITLGAGEDRQLLLEVDLNPSASGANG
jgi:hypothetical protein